MIERDPLQRDSRRSRVRVGSNSTRCYHGIVVRGFWVFCGCAKVIRGIEPWRKSGGLFYKARKDWKWAEAKR